MVLQVPLFKLQCGVNSYEWGKKGEDSAAARFAATTPAEGFTVQSDKPYAELWMGTHPSNPSKDLQSGRTLLDLVQENQQLLSAPVSSKYGSKLPFLFKVLSINKALSIQAHPNKKLAEQLHARDPKNYPDDNHKPEMAIAITPFEGLCGFRPLAEISHFLNTVPPLKALVKEDKADEFINTVKGEEETESAETKEKNKTALQHVFASLLSATTEEIQKQTESLVSLAKSEGSSFAGGGAGASDGETLSELITRSHGEFGADIGLFVLFFLNYVKMEPGEAMFLVADDIHAYLSGDIIECMAASDNVVRAGFTPKFKDVPTLVDMLTYNYAPIDEQKMSPSEYPYATLNRTAYSSGSAVILYDPPIDEFSVVRSLLKGDGSKATFDPLEGPSIIICTSGKGTIAVGPKVEKISEGNVFFVGSTAEVVLQSEGDADDEFITFKAFCEIDERAEEKL
ncbi:Mannose-6-phosphate isomerase [Colletotrichum sp. SAR 10_70]|nr:Mannose-6-phosphate isomerase [Colletotrichum tropicale]KAF4873655.1 Mannose-6-phosphate isomerase [Colletotrichum siamense]KAI8163660.1 Mannose-6-phosphate isomerase [Colletotrichum sp. SAR 10_71]KAI8176414.1 Mannose-6-phosphate isomerase [Colletotrichum sp. SAR 10_65]KAI8183703.1 Mannose-6-phosphate isomerase [Colletotrichum sp. SAR 10_75]KAI8195713.1 Mannose-6-phosphate isomerase [Colletotrichum sp. SAR 10_70]KAI8254261.1 Mannose-6-phosphate isomerase [Colletotrichum sp. SAR 10_98]KAJ5